MLLEKDCPGMLTANDLVCCRSVSDTLMYLIVREDVLLKDNDVRVPVRFPGGTVGFDINSDKLVVKDGQIVALPSTQDTTSSNQNLNKEFSMQDPVMKQ